MLLQRRKLNLPEISHASGAFGFQQTESGSDLPSRQDVGPSRHSSSLGGVVASALVIISDDLGSPLEDLINPFPDLDMVLPQLPPPPSFCSANSLAQVPSTICLLSGVHSTLTLPQRPMKSTHPSFLPKSDSPFLTPLV